MKNEYKKINDEITIIYAKRPDGEIIEIKIDTKYLEKAMKFENSWTVINVKGCRFKVNGTYRENKIKKNISLCSYLLDIKDGTPVRFINGDSLDNRRCNLTVGYNELQITKGNKYIDKGEKVDLILNRKNDTPILTTIDKEDLEKVLSKGTWYPEWHKAYNNYMVVNITKIDNKHRKKIALHSFIMNTTNREQIKHCDGNILNNCKSNLKVYSQTMMNDYIEMDEETVAIIIRDKHGNEIARTLIDKEDLDRVINNGYTWCYFKNPKGDPYAVANPPEGRIYLHRFIMNTPDGMVTDHKEHNTLDNRKSNLKNATLSENQQNRKGARKGSKSGHRGVSWDETNQDWIVVVKGKYYGRFDKKDVDKAIALADEKIKETMSYLDDLK